MNELDLYRYIGNRLPAVPHASGIINRILKPIYNRKPREKVESDVLGRRMLLDPAECVDGNLLFCPQLYDAAEIDFLLNHLRDDSVFVDVGAHIGFYSLQASKKITLGKIVAIEANPSTYRRLVNNIRLNDLDITAVNVGVSDKKEILRLSENFNKNSGGQSFVRISGSGLSIECSPLKDILNKQSVDKADVIKFDIEGFEYKVMKGYFSSIDRACYPTYIITEYIDNDPLQTTGDHLRLLEELGYRVILETQINRILKMP